MNTEPELWWRYGYWTTCLIAAAKHDGELLVERLRRSGSFDASAVDRLLALVEHLESELEIARYEANTMPRADKD